MKSRLLNSDIPVAGTLKGRAVVRHRILEEVIMKAVIQKQIRYCFRPLFMSDGHTAVECEMVCVPGEVSVRKIGEVSAGGIAPGAFNGYPVTLAYNRAFDHAAIAILRLDTPAVSDMDMSDDMIKAATGGARRKTTDGKTVPENGEKDGTDTAVHAPGTYSAPGTAGEIPVVNSPPAPSDWDNFKIKESTEPIWTVRS